MQDFTAGQNGVPTVNLGHRRINLGVQIAQYADQPLVIGSAVAAFRPPARPEFFQHLTDGGYRP